MRALFPTLLLLAACGENRTFPTRGQYQGEQAAPLECVPNLDGRIEAKELKAALGVPVSYLVSPASVMRAVNVAGTVNPQGQRVWDFAADFADDEQAKLEASALTGKWFASAFPAAQFTTPLDAAGRTWAAYSDDGQALYMHGFASAVENGPEGKTLLVYAQPVALYRYPLEVGKTWVTVGQVSNGVLRGLPYAGRDTYSITVEASGRLELPDLTFTQAMRVRTNVTAEPAVGAPVTRRQTGFVFECFGEVARATSQNNETQDDFTQAAEVRRLGLL
jgi:hypothetical protein